MRRQLNPTMPHETWLELFWYKFNWTVYFSRAVFPFRFIACNQIHRFSRLFIFLHLSTYRGRIFLAATKRKKHYRLVLFWARAVQSFYFLMFSSRRVETLQRVRNVWRPNSQISQDGTFVHYPFFVLNIPLFTFSHRNFFPLFVCLDILWHLATKHAHVHPWSHPVWEHLPKQ